MSTNVITRFYYKNKSRAVVILNGLMGIVEDYGVVSVADYYDISTNSNVAYDRTMHRYGWLENMLKKATIDETSNGWTINLPSPLPIDPSPLPIDPNHIICSENTPRFEPIAASTPEPLNICIHVNDLESPGTYISDVFNHISKIKDRMVNLTIM